MTEIIENIIIYGISPTIIFVLIILIIVHIFKKIFENDLTQRLEQVKSELQLEFEKQTTTYNFVFEQRADTLKQLYKLIEDLTTLGGNNINLNVKDYLVKVDEFFIFYKYNRLFINSETCKIIDDFIEKLHELTDLMNAIYSKSKMNKLRSINDTEQFNKIITYDLIQSKKLIESEFKKIFRIDK